MLFLLGACTSSRWVVTERGIIDSSRQPMIIGETNSILLSDSADVSDPVMRFEAFDIVDKRFSERVQVERTVQKYRPKWGFLTIGLAGATFAVLAANTDTIFPSQTVNRNVAMNLAGGMLAALSFSNMKPVGDPIYTGETELKRRSGYQVMTDTLSTNAAEVRDDIDLDISIGDEVLVNRDDILLNEGTFEINLGNLISEFTGEIDSSSVVEVRIDYNDHRSEYEVPVPQFLEPFIRITEPVASIRNSPAENEFNLVTEVGNESTLPYIGPGPDGWQRVRFGGSEVYVANRAGTIEWMSTSDESVSTIFEFEEVPFGEIDVENSVPVLKDREADDRAIILTATRNESRREYLSRDRELFRFYMRYALQMDEEQISEVILESEEFDNPFFNDLAKMDSTGTLTIYVNGQAQVDTTGAILIETEEGKVDLAESLSQGIGRIESQETLILVDLEYESVEPDAGSRAPEAEPATILQRFSDRILLQHPNTAILFSHRPDQTSSLFVKSGVENRRHHIFMYYFAEALKRRNSEVSEILRHLRNHVDYTSRRLHDRPQELQAFGNFTIDLAQ